MDRIAELRAARVALHADMEALVAAIDDETGMTDEQTEAYAAMAANDDRIRAQVTRLEDLERRRAEQAVPVGVIPTPAPSPAPGTVPATPAARGLTFARMTRYMAAAQGNAVIAGQIAEANGDSGLFASQNMGSGAAGGFLVPEDVSNEIIELLRPASVVRAMGARVIPLPNGNMTTNRRATGASFAYGAEQGDAPAAAGTFGQMKLSAKKMSGIVPISNDLLRSASVSVDMLVRDDIVQGAASAEDLHFLRGTGTEYAPLGLRYQLVGSSYATLNILTMTATPDLAKVTTDLGKLELALLNQNLDASGAHWVMSPRTAMYLTNLRDGNGNLAFPEMGSNMLRRKPVHVTTQIPDNLGGGTESEIGLIHPSQVVIGESGGVQIAVSTEAAYKDSGGTMQAAFSRDETLMRLIMLNDIGLRHLPAVAWLTGVTWGV